MKKIYLDDIRTPVDTSWVVVRSYDEFVDKVKESTTHKVINFFMIMKDSLGF